jgi:glycosyltransferase involved in cell wall biosynthesis
VKVTLGIILAGGFPVPTDFVVSYSLLFQTMMSKMGPGQLIDRGRVLFEQNFPIDWARNHCVKSFLDSDDGDYLLFLDADMIHPPDMAHRLVAHGQDVVTAHYVTRKPPHFTVAMRKVGPGHTEYESVCRHGEERGLMPIDAGGAGALLISRRCLKTMREMFIDRARAKQQVAERIAQYLHGADPLLEQMFAEQLRREVTESNVGDDWFRYQDGPEGLRSRSEDMWFFEQARAAGFQPYLDADVKCKHLAQFAIDHTWHEPWKEVHEREMAEKGFA